LWIALTLPSLFILIEQSYKILLIVIHLNPHIQKGVAFKRLDEKVMKLKVKAKKWLQPNYTSFDFTTFSPRLYL